MAVYKVLQKFRDTETKEVYTAEQEIELTVKRADEAIKNLKKYDGEFLKRIDNADEEAERIAKEEAEALKVAEEKAAAEKTKEDKVKGGK